MGEELQLGLGFDGCEDGKGRVVKEGRNGCVVGLQDQALLLMRG